MKTATCTLLTMLGFVSPATAGVQFYDLFYSTFYNQTSALPPTDYALSNFSSRVIADPGDFGTANVILPTVEQLPLNEIGPGYFLYQQDFATQGDSLIAFPPGAYVFLLAGGSQGEQLGVINRPPESFWCEEIPAFTESSYTAMQSVDAASDFWAEFNTFSAPAPANLAATFVYVYDMDGNFVYGTFFGSFTGTVQIPAGTLLAGTPYRISLYFSSRIEKFSENFGGSTAIVGFDRVTTASLFTLLACTGDLNKDGFVDDADFSIFVNAYNTLDCADPIMPAGCPADFNRDGVVDDTDFVLFVGPYNDLLCP
ncbi:MAG: hypothetical protein U0573_04870 [Phycisphaerales bacterium]|nr:hypothetical protein [Planctomycetota bacterium]